MTIPGLLANRGFRLTTPRRAVLEVLFEAATPVSVGGIHARLKNRRINLASVYRTVHLLRDLGVLRLADATTGSQRFELAEQFTGHHHHLICQACGQIGDLEGCVLEEEALDALKLRARRHRKFHVIAHDVQLLGLCHACYAR